jgi:hypothetical protein
MPIDRNTPSPCFGSPPNTSKTLGSVSSSLFASPQNLFHMANEPSRRLPLKIPEMLENSSKQGIQQGAEATSDTANQRKLQQTAEDDIFEAVTALETLKRTKSPTPISIPTPLPKQPSQLQPQGISNAIFNASPKPKPTIFDKVISHPLISNSISYVLEKTINSSTNTLIESNNIPPATSGKTVLPPLNSITKDIPPAADFREVEYNKKGRSPNALTDDTLIATSTKKRPTDYEMDPLMNSKIKRQRLSNPVPSMRLKRKGDLRQQVSISSALAAHQSIEEIKRLSTLNLNIESRKKLTMLIHFLKLGNNQLSERIDKLIQNVDHKKGKLGLTIPNTSSSSIDSRSNSEIDINIQQIKEDIITTVKKIVNVVSQVSAQSLSEPARSNVRDAILKLPTNWATMLNKEATSDGDDDEDDDEDGNEEAAEYSDSDSDNDSDTENEVYQDTNEEFQDDQSDSGIEKMTVNNKAIFKRTRKPSMSRRLMNSLIEYRKMQGQSFDRNTSKVRKWFREKIKRQIMHDSSGKVLILAQESLDMVNKIIKFCNDSLDKAENWNLDRQYRHQMELLHRLQTMNQQEAATTGAKQDVVTVSRTQAEGSPQERSDVLQSKTEEKPHENETDLSKP